MSIDWTQLRRQMPIVKQWAYMDHSAVAPLPEPTAEAIRTWCDQATNAGDTVWMSWHESVQRVRQSAANILNAQPSEIALVPSTTAGISLVADGFPWQPGDNVVTLGNEFPSNIYPWLNQRPRGVEVRVIEIDEGQVDVNRVVEAIDSRTRIVAVSWVGYASGWRLDLAEITRATHDRGALVMVDAIQGLGVFPLDVKRIPIDFLAADGHKWLLGPEGAGLFYLRHEHLSLLRPMGVGWNSVSHAFDFDTIELDLRDEASRYEGGSQNMVGFIGLGASLDLLQQCGLAPNTSPVAERVVKLGDYAADQLRAVGAKMLTSRPENHRSGIITFQLPNTDPQALRQACYRERIAVSCRGGGVRISPHAYNTEEEIDHLVKTVTSS